MATAMTGTGTGTGKDSFPIEREPKKRGQVQGRVSRQGGVTANLWVEGLTRMARPLAGC
jgi:hypothetical protein